MPTRELLINCQTPEFQQGCASSLRGSPAQNDEVKRIYHTGPRLDPLLKTAVMERVAGLYDMFSAQRCIVDDDTFVRVTGVSGNCRFGCSLYGR
jgi:hypothetical protein